MAKRKGTTRKPSKKRKGNIRSSVWDNWKSSWKKRSPVFQFIFVFVLALILFYSLYNAAFFNNYVVNPITHAQARVSSTILNLLGQQTSVEGNVLRNASTALDIKKGCDGIEPTVFFLIGVLLVPFSWRAKRYGLLIGFLAISLLNLLRIIGLYFAKVYWPQYFDALHVHGGFALFFLIALVLWMAWASWALKQYPSIENADHV